MKTDRSQDIRDRTFSFACRVARLCLDVGTQPRIRPIVEQLLKSGTAIGANLEEAKAGSSKREFVRYVEISLREARETVYWLRIFLALHIARELRFRIFAAKRIKSRAFSGPSWSNRSPA